MAIKNNKGFTLVEMLVVIAIISVLAAALFPAINNALGTASATALKNKGRGIWVAITSANMEREPLNKGTVWPEDIEDEVSSAADYFNYLLSEDETTTPSQTQENQIVADLTPDSLVANGVTVAKKATALTADNIAWAVFVVGDSTPAQIPFLITRNFKGSSTKGAQLNSLSSADDKDVNNFDLEDVNPFKKARAVWVSRGGGTFDARAKYLTQGLLFGFGAPKDDGDYELWTVEPTKKN